MIGKPQFPAKPRITSETANPEVWTQAPNSASAGVPLCTFSSAANANGPSTASSASSRVGNCARSFSQLGRRKRRERRARRSRHVARSGCGNRVVMRLPAPARRIRSARVPRARLVRRQREEHALQRADAQLESPDRDPRIAEREHVARRAGRPAPSARYRRAESAARARPPCSSASPEGAIVVAGASSKADTGAWASSSAAVPSHTI